MVLLYLYLITERPPHLLSTSLIGADALEFFGSPKPRRSWERNVPAETHYAIYYANYERGAVWRDATRAFPMQMHTVV